MRRERPDAGTFYFGAKVRPGYYEQHMTGLNDALSALEEVREAYPRMDDTAIRTALAAFCSAAMMSTRSWACFPAVNARACSF